MEVLGAAADPGGEDFHTMSGKRWHVPSASATPWDDAPDGELTPSQRLVRDAQRRAYEHRHLAPALSGGASFFNAYEPGACPWCGGGRVRRSGFTGSGIQRWLCPACGRTSTPVTGTVFEGHRRSLDDWFEFVYQAFSFESVSAMTRLDRRSGTTTPYWMGKLFAVLRGVQDGVVLSGGVQIDETMYPLAARDRAGGRAGMGAYPKDKICIAVGVGGGGRGIAVKLGLGKPSKGRAWDAYGGHIAPGSTLSHDMENSHGVLVERLGLESARYRAAEISRLPDSENPLAEVNHMCFLVKEFLRRHSGFDRDGIDDWLNLFSVIVNPPEDRLEKAAMVLDRAMHVPVSLPYREFYGQNTSSSGR